MKFCAWLGGEKENVLQLEMKFRKFKKSRKWTLSVKKLLKKKTS